MVTCSTAERNPLVFRDFGSHFGFHSCNLPPRSLRLNAFPGLRSSCLCEQQPCSSTKPPCGIQTFDYTTIFFFGAVLIILILLGCTHTSVYIILQIHQKNQLQNLTVENISRTPWSRISQKYGIQELAFAGIWSRGSVV